ncbi:MAG: peptidyl-prolyl cis-trans isomerase [Planctomycetia bacterium]|nr:peptidyl-prolyl cis-trans isomerase [Planctomycetia bacterium]
MNKTAYKDLCNKSVFLLILTVSLFFLGNSEGYSQSEPVPGQTDPSASNSSGVESGKSDSQKKPGDVQFSPQVSGTKIYYEGAETIGRVGHEAILKRDILHQLRKMAQLQWLHVISSMSEEDKKTKGPEIRKQILKECLTDSKIYTETLDNYIRKLLYYNDFVVSRPKEQITEQNKKLTDIFNSDYVPEIMKQFHCKTYIELEEYYKKELLSTLEQEKRLFIQDTIGSSWLEFNLGSDQFKPTGVDLRRYYEAHMDRYKVDARIKWQALSVRFSNHPIKQEAYNKIVSMGNYVLSASSPEEQKKRFTEIAKKESEDFFARDGGVRDWTKRGALNSKIIEDAIFSKDLPVGALSRILEDDMGYTIVSVLKREDDYWKPFVEVQEEVRKKLLEDRKDALKLEYERTLSKRFTIELYTVGAEEQQRRFQTYFKQSQSATGRELK